MTGDRFVALIGATYRPFLAELGFKEEAPHVSGRFYEVRFVGDDFEVCVSFEPGDQMLHVLVPPRDPTLAEIDDPRSTARLRDLNRRYLGTVPQEEVRSSSLEFSGIDTRDDHERLLVKAANELRLVLPRYLADRRGGRRA